MMVIKVMMANKQINKNKNMTEQLPKYYTFTNIYICIYIFISNYYLSASSCWKNENTFYIFP